MKWVSSGHDIRTRLNNAYINMVEHKLGPFLHKGTAISPPELKIPIMHSKVNWKFSFLILA